jgi:hypothetical protein
LINLNLNWITSKINYIDFVTYFYKWKTINVAKNAT